MTIRDIFDRMGLLINVTLFCMFPLKPYEFDGISKEDVDSVVGNVEEPEMIVKVNMVDKLIDLFYTKHGIKEGFYKEDDGNYSTYDGNLNLDIIRHFCGVVSSRFLKEGKVNY